MTEDVPSWNSIINSHNTKLYKELIANAHRYDTTGDPYWGIDDNRLRFIIAKAMDNPNEWLK